MINVDCFVENNLPSFSIHFSFQIKFAHTACTETQTEVIFANETDITCCETCTAGYGVRVKCSTKENTECEPCISGKTYSNETKHTNSCKKCFTCGDNAHFILHPCNISFMGLVVPFMTRTVFD